MVDRASLIAGAQSRDATWYERHRLWASCSAWVVDAILGTQRDLRLSSSGSHLAEGLVGETIAAAEQAEVHKPTALLVLDTVAVIVAVAVESEEHIAEVSGWSGRLPDVASRPTVGLDC